MSSVVDLVLLTEVFVTLFVIMDPVGTVPIFLGLTSGRSPASARRAAWQAVGVSFLVISVFAFFTTLGMLGCGVASLWIYLAPMVGNAQDALWSALLLFGITVGLGIGSYCVLRSKGQDDDVPLSSAFFDNIGGEITRAVANSKGSVLLSALLAGMAYGSSRK